MKKLLMSSVCVFLAFSIASCSHSATTSDSGSGTSSSAVTQEELASQIEAMKAEIEALKATVKDAESALSSVEKEALLDHGFLIDALDAESDDDIYLGMDRTGDVLTAVYIKIPKPQDGKAHIHRYILMTGYEKDGCVFFDAMIVPQYNHAEDQRYADYGVDKNQSQIIKLFLPDIHYDDTSVMRIFFVDPDGVEYSKFVQSVLSAKDV